MAEYSREEWEESYGREIRSKKVPKSLYKFRRWHCGHDERSLDADCIACKRERLILSGPAVWFASPASFNDPFDCRIPYRFDLMPHDQKIERIMRLGRMSEPGWGEDKLRATAEREARDNPLYSTDPDKRRPAMEDYWKGIDSRYGVLPVAGNCDNILMWSHYADSHKGFCVEFDAHLLSRSLFDLSRTEEQHIGIYGIRYPKVFPVVIPSNDDAEDLDRHMSLLTTKSSDWDYEQEWRFIDMSNTKFEQPISRDIIKRVILGCEMPKEHRKEIYDLVSDKFPHARVDVAVTHPDRFELEFKQYDPERDR